MKRVLVIAAVLFLNAAAGHTSNERADRAMAAAQQERARQAYRRWYRQQYPVYYQPRPMPPLPRRPISIPAQSGMAITPGGVYLRTPGGNWLLYRYPGH